MPSASNPSSTAKPEPMTPVPATSCTNRDIRYAGAAASAADNVTRTTSRMTTAPSMPPRRRRSTAVEITIPAAYDAAEREAVAANVELIEDEFVISDDGSIDLGIRHTATTLFLYRTSQTAKWAVMNANGHASGKIR